MKLISFLLPTSASVKSDHITLQLLPLRLVFLLDCTRSLTPLSLLDLHALSICSEGENLSRISPCMYSSLISCTRLDQNFAWTVALSPHYCFQGCVIPFVPPFFRPVSTTAVSQASPLLYCLRTRLSRSPSFPSISRYFHFLITFCTLALPPVFATPRLIRRLTSRVSSYWLAYSKSIPVLAVTSAALCKTSLLSPGRPLLLEELL